MSLSQQFLIQWRKSSARRWISHNLEYLEIPREYRQFLGRQESGMLVRIGIRPVSVVVVSIKDLFLQHRSEWPVHQYHEKSGKSRKKLKNMIKIEKHENS